MVNQQLLDYIKQQINQGVSRETINNNLIQQGWSGQDLNEAFSTASPNIGSSPQKGKTGLIIGIVIGLVVLCGLLFVGWNMMQKKAAEVQLENVLENALGGNADVKIGDNNDFSIKTDKGSLAVGNSASMPSGWPSEISQYPGSKIEMSSNSSDSGSPQSVMSLATGDSPEKVMAYYKSILNTSGWTNLQDQSFGSFFTIGAEKGAHALAITATVVSGETKVNMIYHEKDAAGN
jgi:hypothetical protein